MDDFTAERGNLGLACIASEDDADATDDRPILAFKGLKLSPALTDRPTLPTCADVRFLQLRQYSRFNDVACLNYGVHVYEGGDVLSIVVDAGAHGTHVAGTLQLRDDVFLGLC